MLYVTRLQGIRSVFMITHFLILSYGRMKYWLGIPNIITTSQLSTFIQRRSGCLILFYITSMCKGVNLETQSSEKTWGLLLYYSWSLLLMYHGCILKIVIT